MQMTSSKEMCVCVCVCVCVGLLILSQYQIKTSFSTVRKSCLSPCVGRNGRGSS
jgi:hypothetical protein